MDREAHLRDLERAPLDVLVIGGGITGAGVALDAVSRGLRTGLVERDDFASGTSSKSSKLIHGGLRYLAQFQIKVTLEASREKALLQKLAPHLIEDLKFVLPLYKGPVDRAMTAVGLWIYDTAAGLPGGRIHERLGPAEAMHRYPLLDPARVHGAYVYHDARTDDCRLVMHVIKKAADLGALVVNHASVEKLELPAATIRDRVSGRTFEVRAKNVVNATGVWCDELRRRDDPKAEPVVRVSKGVHLVFDRERLPFPTAAILPSPKDARVVFIIPWSGRLIVGTTDTDYAGPLDRPRAEADDVRYLLDLLNDQLPTARLTPADVLGTYAGLRPLLLDGAEAPSKVSREHHLFRSKSGLITITGGKLTTYRRMAKEVVDTISRKPCRTHKIDLFAVPATDDALVQRYGSEATEIADRAPIVAGLPFVWGEVGYSIQREMAVTLADVLERRTRLSLTDRDRGRKVAEAVAQRMGSRLGWDAAERARQIEAYEASLG